MRKSLFVFVVLTVLAMAVPASAQSIRWGYIPQTTDGWYYLIRGNQVGMLTADNLGMVRDLSNQLRRSEIRSLADDLRWNGSAYGLYGARGFYPMYDRQMKPMSRREATITYGALGAGAGYAIFRNTRGTVAGAVIGGIVGLATHRGGNKDVVVTPPPQDQQSVYVGPDGIPVAVGTRLADSVQVVEPPRPAWKIFRNRFEGLEVRIHVVGENPEEYISVPAGGEVSKQLPGDAKIWAEVMVWKGSRQVPIQELGQRELPYHSGWVFFNPTRGEL